MLTDSEIKAYTVDIPNDIQAAQRASGCASVNGCAALVAKIRDARRLSHGCWVAGYSNENKRQRHYSAGQLDAFDAVLSWIAEAQHNGDLSGSSREKSKP